jgi:hypothetical protein
LIRWGKYKIIVGITAFQVLEATGLQILLNGVKWNMVLINVVNFTSPNPTDMKKVFLLFVLSVVISGSSAQISYETTYYSDHIEYPVIKYFNHTSPKWLMVTTSTVSLYNLNYSLYRQFPNYGGSFFIQYLTEDLFDTDSSNFEYICWAGNTMKIFREDGTLIFSHDSVELGGPAKMIDWDHQQNIFPTDSGVKMRVNILDNPGWHCDIYLLPGTLPCQTTCGGAPYNPTIVQGASNLNQKKLLSPYPNPASNEIHIPIELQAGENGEIIFYDLAGAEVKRYKVDSTFKDLILSAADLSAGSYYYQLQTPNSKSAGKKLVVIK